MPELANARWELFSVLVARGQGTEAECYVQAGYKPTGARANASRLIATDSVSSRIQELKAQFTESVKIGLAVTTTDVARHLWQLSHYDVTEVFAIETAGRGRSRRQRVTVKDTKDWPEAMKRTCQGVKIAADGTIMVMLPDRRQSGIKVGEHLGMFQGESNTTLVDNSTNTVVYVDAPRTETKEQWQARVAKERGIKLVEGKVV